MMNLHVPITSCYFRILDPPPTLLFFLWFLLFQLKFFFNFLWVLKVKFTNIETLKCTVLSCVIWQMNIPGNFPGSFQSVPQETHCSVSFINFRLCFFIWRICFRTDKDFSYLYPIFKLYSCFPKCWFTFICDNTPSSPAGTNGWMN